MDEEKDNISEIIDIIQNMSHEYMYTVTDDCGIEDIRSRLTSTFCRVGCVVGEDVEFEVTTKEFERSILNISIKAISDKGREILQYISNQS